MGSIGDNTSGGAYGYRMSKAALNMASKSMSVDLASEGILSVVVNPGWVQTDMGGSGAPLPVEGSAKNILTLIDRLRIEDSGSFFNHTGARFEW
jgi:NAD(P)-dependent dehydrogenase (short-subunit alcohol dehydrogenase family)